MEAPPHGNNKVTHPAVTYTMIVAIVTAIIGVTTSYSELSSGVDSKHLIAMSAIEHEKQIRMLTGNNIEKKLDSLEREFKREAQETQRLLGELLKKSRL